MTTNAEKYPHYYKDVTTLTSIDVYRVLELFEVSDPCIQHAIKKLLVAGGRGGKDLNKDVQEAIVSLERWQEMRKEEKSLLDIFIVADTAEINTPTLVTEKDKDAFDYLVSRGHIIVSST